MGDRLKLFKKSNSIKSCLVPILLLFSCFTISCIHAPAPYRPNSWLSSPIGLKPIVDNPNQPLLQVIIVYGPAWDLHSALRLVCPGQSVLFWDPGGSDGPTLPENV
jgi:hypothetical protein